MSIYKKIYNKIYYTLDKYTPPQTIRKGGADRALISYIIKPFRDQADIFHCNVVECLKMADVLMELGYTVDIVDYRFKRNIEYNKYELIMGFGYPYRNSFTNTHKEIIRISYMTGANPNFSNFAEAKRIKALKERKGKFLVPKREVYWPWTFSTLNSDAIIVVGNEWTSSTYEGFNDHIYTVPVPFICSPENTLLKKDAINNFVWFAGPGAVHKGLDLAIEAITALPGKNKLHICGNLKNEKELLALYHKELNNSSTIQLYGIINPNGAVMKTLCEESAFVLFPSCSEGTASSVITCMAKGLIPIVTKESGINLQGFGIEICGDSVDSVIKAIQKAKNITEDEIHKQREAVKDYVIKYHSENVYKACIKKALQAITVRDKKVYNKISLFILL